MTSTKNSLDKLQKIQNIACWLILKADKRESTARMHKTLNFLKLDKRRNIHLASLCHKNIYTEGGNPLSKLFNKIMDGNRCTTRHANKMNMKIPRINSQTGRKSIEYRGPHFWNLLEPDLKLNDNLNSLKKNLFKRAYDELDNHPT